jgi:hypothetical protein
MVIIKSVTGTPVVMMGRSTADKAKLERAPLSNEQHNKAALSGRDNKIKQWSELGEFQNISDAARRVLELEGDRLGALFFRVYVDPLRREVGRRDSVPP